MRDPLAPMLNATSGSSQSISAFSAMYPFFFCSSGDDFTYAHDTVVVAVWRVDAEGPKGIYTYICHVKPCNLQSEED